MRCPTDAGVRFRSPSLRRGASSPCWPAVAFWSLCLALGWSGRCLAHELQPAYLELLQVEPERFAMTWTVPALERYGVKELEVLLPGGSVTERQRSDLTAGLRRISSLVYRPGGLDGQKIRVGGLENSATDVLVVVRSLSGGVQVERLTAERPVLVVKSAAPSGGTFTTYLTLGIEHILLGADHLLFVLGLLLMVRQRWMLLKSITAFTLAHSLTLAAATLGFASVPAEPLNACIALSILFLGPEIVRLRRGETSLAIRHPWAVAFAFGLLHGFGFASGLTTLGMARSEIPMALLGFNVGVELGQVGFVFLVLGLVSAWQVLEVRWPRWMEALPGVAVGSLGGYWFVQRTVLMVNGWS